MFDLIVRNATLPDGRTGLDIGIRDGKIAALERGLSGEAGRTIDAQGLLVSPPFVDIHFHMDATLSLGNPRLNQSGTLLERHRAVGRIKAVADPRSRRRARCATAISRLRGLLRSAAMSIPATTA